MKVLERHLNLEVKNEELSVEENPKTVYESCDLFYEFPAETSLTVFRWLEMGQEEAPGRSLAPAGVRVLDASRWLVEWKYSSFSKSDSKSGSILLSRRVILVA